ncbi:ABC transporter, ATPase subunit [Lentisphaera araneosa HTCC2155]|uniref:ABC transporter, ATPase subunit n=1 Tax=Lentisphaera araneosa HTCC2155 TaxID=313628 RepID=A6DH10_9BACT|nr:ABC-F family ATP-binding cassette domain-containing protein [Lentisphaera araneosa]EDM28893.1 ABC transporter, ATPase subunit [Lentisphaera araneosa HTCC2155]
MFRFDNIRKAYAGRMVLDDTSFHVHPGERAGLVGPNGAGKSTIFRILTGQESSDKGDVKLRKNIRIGWLRQNIPDELKHLPLLEFACKARPDLEAIQERIIELEKGFSQAADQDKLLAQIGDLQHEFEAGGGYLIETAARTCLSGLGFSEAELEKPICEFSGGWQMRAELVRVVISDPDLLLLDEPTNYLDVPAVEWLREFMVNFRGTLLLISHDRYLLNELTDVTYEVYGGQVTRYPGNYDQYKKVRDERMERLEVESEKLERKKEKLEGFVNRFKAKASKATQAKSRMKQLEKLESVDTMVKVSSVDLRLGTPPAGSPVPVELEDMSKTYDGERYIYQNLSMAIQDGEKIAVVGSNGMGKSTLLKILANKLPIEEGKVSFGHKTTIGYHAQELTENFSNSLNLIEQCKSFAADTTEGRCRQLLGSFGFHGDDVFKLTGVLSGGEKIRLSLLKLLLAPQNLLLLDEPTTHLDIQAVESLQDALKEFPGTVCFVSHDIEFIRGVADTIFEVTPEGFRKFHGDYDYYMSKIKDEVTLEEQQEKSKVQESSGLNRKEQRRKEAEERKSLKKKRGPLEKRTQALEKLIADLEAEESALVEEFYQEPPSDRMQVMNNRLDEISTEKESAEAEWEEKLGELELVLAQIEEGS